MDDHSPTGEPADTETGGASAPGGPGNDAGTRTPRPRLVNRLAEGLLTVVAMPVLPFLIAREMRRTALPFVAVQESMLPTIRPGDQLLALPLEHCGPEPLQRGDIVVFESWHDGEDTAVKRVIACPGDTIDIHGHGVFVNGAPLDEPYALPPTHGTLGPATLAPGYYFVLGDNRCNSCDSRVHGPLSLERVIGRMIYRTRPLTRMGSL